MPVATKNGQPISGRLVDYSQPNRLFIAVGRHNLSMYDCTSKVMGQVIRGKLTGTDVTVTLVDDTIVSIERSI